MATNLAAHPKIAISELTPWNSDEVSHAAVGSPLRYPGGKARLGKFLAKTILLNNLDSCVYAEPFAGGAGAALSLLYQGIVSKIVLNDADVRIFAFWNSVLNETDDFVDRILKCPISIREWHVQKAICDNPQKHSTLDVGFAAFFLNRCNRSGVLDGAGPIGGYSQRGPWKLSVRFSRAALAERVLKIGQHRKNIKVTNLDAIKFLKKLNASKQSNKTVFAYLDPPYVTKGKRLYLNSYVEADHALLADYVQTQARMQWIMSYDDDEIVRHFYSRLRISKLALIYSLQVKRLAHELIISPRHLKVPSECKPLTKREMKLGIG